MKRRLINIVILGVLLTSAIAMQAQLLPYPIDTIDGQLFYRYEVEKSIGLYRVSKNFGVTQEELIKYNPAIEQTGLRYGETVLRIPVKGEGELKIENGKLKIENAQEPIVESQETRRDSVETRVESQEAKVDVKVRKYALLLPLQANIIQRDANMDRFFDFYEGVLLAIHDMQSAEQKYELHVYDIGKSQTGVQKLIAENKLAGMDAIIGPAYPAQVLTISDWAKTDSTPVLIPFIDKVIDIDSNPWLLQFNTTEETEAQAMVDYLVEHKDSINCVLVDAPSQDIPKNIRLIREGIKHKGLSYTTTTIRDILNDSLDVALRSDMENILIFNTQKYSNIHFLMPRILNIVGNKRISLMSQYSWQSENIILPQIFTSDFTAEDSEARDQYEHKFAMFFGNEHASELPRYDLLGYDLTRELSAWLDGSDYKGLQSEIRFERVGENGGLQNKYIRVVRK